LVLYAMPARRLTEHLQREIPPGHTLREGITGAETGKERLPKHGQILATI